MQQVRRLAERREREARRLCVAEGPHLVAEAAAAGAVIELLLVLAGSAWAASGSDSGPELGPAAGGPAGRGAADGGGAAPRDGAAAGRASAAGGSAAGGSAAGGPAGGAAGGGGAAPRGGVAAGGAAAEEPAAKGPATTGSREHGGSAPAGSRVAGWPGGLPPARRLVTVGRRVLDAVAETEAPQGVLAVVRIPEARPPAGGGLVVAADGLRDPGNLGTLLRTALAFGAAALVLGPGCADPWGGKALRAAAGATFRLPPFAVPDLAGWLRGRGGGRWALVPRGGAPLPQADLGGPEPVTLVVGSEAAGVSAEVAAACRTLTVPMPGAAESLNAAVAASVALYEAARQRASRQA